jgi:hypothetical protein
MCQETDWNAGIVLCKLFKLFRVSWVSSLLPTTLLEDLGGVRTLFKVVGWTRETHCIGIVYE